MFQHAFKLLALYAFLFPIPVASYTYYRDADTCDLVGDGDIYGIGVRVSIYIQSFTAMIALLGAGPAELRTLRLSSNAIATAIIFVFMRDMHRSSFLYLEYCIIFGLLQFFLSVFNWTSLSMIARTIMEEKESQSHGRETLPSPSNLDRIATKEEFWNQDYQSIGDVDYFSIAWTLLLSSILLVIQVWVFSGGLHIGHPSACRAFINLYGNIDMYNTELTHLVLVFTVLASTFLLPTAVIFIISYLMLGFFFEFEKIHLKKLPAGPDGLSFSAKLQTKLAKLLARYSALVKGSDEIYICLTLTTSSSNNMPFTIAYTLIGLFVLFSGIFWAEHTISANNIDLSATTISSTGQLIPLLVTILTSVPTLWTVFLALLKKWTEGSVYNRNHENGTTDETTEETNLLLEETDDRVRPALGGGLMIDAGAIV